MKIFVTGGSGFVGGHVIERLAQSHEVTAMARSERSAKIVESYGATAVRCSLGEVLPEHLAGVDVVVHSAAYVEEWGTRETFFRINVEGTRQLLDVARQAGVTRFIHIGTEAALFTGDDLVEVDEDAPYPARQRFLYSETKAEAEKLVLGANDETFTTISLRPSMIWGPRDASILPAVLQMVERGSFTWLDGGDYQTSRTHVANLVRAVELALVEGRGGQAYFIADDDTSQLRAFLTELAATEGVELPSKSIPGWVARSAAGVAEVVWRTLSLSGQPPVTRFTASMMSSARTLRTDKARAELGYEPVVALEDGLRQMTEVKLAA